MSVPPRTVACPQCAAPVEWSPTSRWRPFCSERCRMMDVAAWASEAYRIPVEDATEDESPRVPGAETDDGRSG
jgi:uncharacterized protein